MPSAAVLASLKRKLALQEPRQRHSKTFASTLNLIRGLGQEVQTSTVWWRDNEGLNCPFVVSEQINHLIKLNPVDPLTSMAYESYVGWWCDLGESEDYPVLDNRYTNYNLP